MLNKPFQMTTWENPTSHTTRFELFEGPGEIHKIEIEPGGRVDLPSKYDNAIRTVRDGVVVGGLAPLLVAKGRDRVPVHAAITAGAAEGDREREALLRTGSTAGALSLDASVSLQAQNDELSAVVKRQADEIRQQGEFFAAKLRELEGKLNAPAAPDKPAAGSPAQRAPGARGSAAAADG